MASDWELLQRYAKSRDQAAFAELAQRHVNMVYGAARRMLRGPGKGEDDVVQAVFLLLSQKANRIGQNTSLGGWLFRTTRYCCANLKKQETRRHAREREAGMQSQETTVAQDLSLVLDEALETLGRKDRDAILARFLEGKSPAETAATLDISPAAAEKRTQRGLAKLRGFFTRKGFTVPAAGVTAFLAAEHAKAAPAGIAASAAGVTAGTSTTVITIAKGAAAMMKMATLKVAMAVMLAVIVLAGGAVVVAESVAKPGQLVPPTKIAAAETAPAQPPVEPPFPPIGTQHEMMARWDVLLNQQGMARLKKELTVVATQSKGYQAYDADAEKLRIAMKEASTASNILLLPHSMGWASMNRHASAFNNADFGLWSHNLQGFIKLGAGGKDTVSVFSEFMNNAAYAEARQNAVRLKINPVDFTPTAKVSGGPNLAGGPHHMQFQGDVPVGKVVVFAGQWGEVDGTELWHVSVWQAFACGTEEYGYVQNASPTDWIESGIDQERAVADQAILWSAQAKHAASKVEPKWEKTLPNGGVLRLIAVGMPARWRFCWWDAQGQPVKWDQSWEQEVWQTDKNGVVVMVQAEDSTVPEPRINPQETTDERRSVGRCIVSQNGKVEVGLAAGPWQDGGAIKEQQELEVKGVKVKFLTLTESRPKTEQMSGESWIAWDSSSRPEVEVEIATFDRAGKEIPERRAPQIYWNRTVVTREDMLTATTLVGAAMEDIHSYRVRWRERYWTTFEGFAKMPVISPDKVQAESEKPGTTKGAESGPAAAAPLPGTPEAFMGAMRAATASGDVKEVRALMLANDPLSKQMADTMAEMAVGQNALRVAAEKAFGPEDTQRALVATGLASPRTPPAQGKGKWKVEGKRATRISEDSSVHFVGPGGTLVRVDGQWRMEIALSEEVTASQRKEMESKMTVMEGMAALPGEMAKEIGEGKYKDAYAARDAMMARRNKLIASQKQ